AMKQSDGHADIPFVPMFLKSLIICLIVGYILIFIIQPMLMNMLFKKYKVGRYSEGRPGAPGPGAPGRP
ncbi:MAG: hypothetical protein IJJ89_01760, partial [Eubacterium sp.]|nr:hypothetical protein [Eubacterium sp.]